MGGLARFANLPIIMWTRCRKKYFTKSRRKESKRKTKAEAMKLNRTEYFDANM